MRDVQELSNTAGWEYVLRKDLFLQPSIMAPWTKQMSVSESAGQFTLQSSGGTNECDRADEGTSNGTTAAGV